MICQGCGPGSSTVKTNDDSTAMVKLITLDPGHFHAALVQKFMSAGVDSVVQVYAPAGPELDAHLALISQYNHRAEAPTHWVEQVHTGGDFFDKMIADRKGNVVVLAGNNLRKTQYITRSVEAGLNVLGDKPMAINRDNFLALEKDFALAQQKHVLLYDIMTERSEITNQLQQALSNLPEVFGKRDSGSVTSPSVTIESVHYFYKFVSGNALTRPAWFFDPAQQGEAIADVGTHLVDLVQWSCFPGVVLDYKKDIRISQARTWTTPVTRSQFSAVTKKDSFPGFLRPYVRKDTILDTHANGEISYMLRGVHVKLTARWEYQAPEGSGDTHYCLMKGSLASLEIRQGAGESYKPTLYIWPVNNSSGYDNALKKGMASINARFPGVTLEKSGKGWKLDIPEKYKVGHEAHFGQVMQRFLGYMKTTQLPDWEVPGMICKYYTTTSALEMAAQKNK